MAFCLRVNVVPLITDFSTCTQFVDARGARQREYAKERINFKSYDIMYISLYRREIIII